MSFGTDDSDNSKKPKSGKDLNLPEKPDGLDEPTGFIDTNQAPKDPVTDLFDALQNARQKNTPNEPSSDLETSNDQTQQDQLELEITRFTNENKKWFTGKQTALLGGLTVLLLGVYSWGFNNYVNDDQANKQKQEVKKQNGKIPVKQIFEGNSQASQSHVNTHKRAPSQIKTNHRTPPNRPKIRRWKPKQAPVPDPRDQERKEDERNYRERVTDEGIHRKKERPNKAQEADEEDQAEKGDDTEDSEDEDSEENNDDEEDAEDSEDDGNFFEE